MNLKWENLQKEFLYNLVINKIMSKKDLKKLAKKSSYEERNKRRKKIVKLCTNKAIQRKLMVLQDQSPLGMETGKKKE